MISKPIIIRCNEIIGPIFEIWVFDSYRVILKVIVISWLSLGPMWHQNWSLRILLNWMIWCGSYRRKLFSNHEWAISRNYLVPQFWCQITISRDTPWIGVISEIWSLVHLLAYRVLDKVILDLFSAKRYWRKWEKNLEITTYQNVYKRSDLRFEF